MTSDWTTENRLSRRNVLTSVGTGNLAFLAGCAGSENDGNGGEPETTSDNDNDNSSTQTNDDGSDGPEVTEPNVQVLNTKVFEAPLRDEGSDWTWAEVELENPTEVIHRDVRVELRFRDTNRDIIDTREHFTALLPEETTMRSFSRHNFDVDEVDTIDYLITDQNVGIRGEFVESFNVLNKSVTKEGSVVRVTGELDFDHSGEDFTIAPLVFNENDEFVGAFRIMGSGVEDETIAFSGGLAIFDTPATRPKPNDARLSIAQPYL